MSLAINIATSEGLVLAADSRETYQSRNGILRPASDNVTKIIKLNERMGVTIKGVAFLPKKGDMNKLLKQFKKVYNTSDSSVRETAEALSNFLGKEYNWQKSLEKLPKEIEGELSKEGLKLLKTEKKEHGVKFEFQNAQGKRETGTRWVEAISLLVAGYNKDASHAVYAVRVPGDVEMILDSRAKDWRYGGAWGGETDIIERIIFGYDDRAGDLPFVKEAEQKYGREKISKQAQGLKYAIRWEKIALQDAIDFCSLAIQVTASIQHISDGTEGDPGGVVSVGGAVDVAVITPEGGFAWVAKKELEVRDGRIVN